MSLCRCRSAPSSQIQPILLCSMCCIGITRRAVNCCSSASALTAMRPIPAPKFSAVLSPLMMNRCNCGSPAIQCRRNLSKRRQIQSWIVCAHNDAFETAIEHHIMVPRHGWPEIPPAQHRCTMAAASALGLPARLSMAADALELANRKDVAGERLMHQTSKPRRARQRRRPRPGPLV